MRALLPSLRLPTTPKVKGGLRLLLLLGLLGGGTLLIVDQAGLRTEYFALGEPWEGRPLSTSVGEPHLESASRIRDALMTKVVFSVRWSGWWNVREGGDHHFSLSADDGGYLRIDDELVVDTEGLFGDPLEAGRVQLKPGFHSVEVGLYQTRGESHLELHWTRPGAEIASTESLPTRDLYTGRPLAPRRALRRGLSEWPRAYRQVLGATLLIAAILLWPGLGVGTSSPARRLAARLKALDGRRLRVALLLALVVLAFLATLPLTGAIRGGDDSGYLNAASFNRKAWFFNRYGHVYLIKLFTTLSGGETLQGVRLWWSFAFATTVGSLAVAVASIGPRLQLRTLAVTLFVLLAQTPMTGLIGGGFADYSAMMFVTLAVATFLHWHALDKERPPPAREWHALAIGALTVCAFRSKEVGAVLLILPILFLVGRGRLDLRRFARQMAYWATGAFSTLLTFVLLDGLILGDLFFTLDGSRLATSEKMNFPTELGLRKAPQSWLRTIWSARAEGINTGLRYLWLMVPLAAIVAGFRRRRIGLRLLHLLPIAYLLALILLYVRMPHPFSARMLVPILPTASLMVGLILHYAALDDLPWKEMLKPLVLLPLGLTTALWFYVVVPYRLGTLDASSLLPTTWLRHYGWEPDHFVGGVLLPASVLLFATATAFVAHRRRGRIVALLVVFLALFGVSFGITRASLARNWAVQKAELLLYPWETFRDELDAEPAQTVALSRDLEGYFHMSSVTRTGIARVALGRQDLRVVSIERAPTDADIGIASFYGYQKWLRQSPALAATASFDPGGFLVLVRPKEAARLTAEGGWSHATEPDLAERLRKLTTAADPRAHRTTLRAILDHLEGPDGGRSIGLQRLQGDRIRAIGLMPDGWTHGAEPAGIIIRNLGNSPSSDALRLVVHAPSSGYPMHVYINDGESLQTVRFDASGGRRLALPTLAPGASRLIVIWSEKAWLPANQSDQRELGVRIVSVPS